MVCLALKILFNKMILLDYVLEWNYRSSEKQMTYTSLADILRYLRVYDSEFHYVYNMENF